MNTRKSSNNVFYSAIHLSIACLVIAMGVIFLMIPHSPHLREWLSEKPKILVSIGLSVVTAGFLLLIGFFFMYRKRYIQVRMGCTKTTIEEGVIREYIHKYWQSLFPEETFDLEIRIGRNQTIEIITALPKNIESLFERIQNELGVLLARKLGYEKDFILTLTEL